MSQMLDNNRGPIQFSLSALAIAAVLLLSHSEIAAAEAFKTSKGEVVVTGLVPAQRYQIRTLSMDNKPGTRQDKSANRCGEVVVQSAARYQTLVVGTVTVDPATLPVQTYERCKPLTFSGSMKPTGVVEATMPKPR